MTTPAPLARSSSSRSLGNSAMQALRHSTTSTFFGLLIVGFIARVAFVFSAGHHMNSDHAIVFLMAKHAAQGEFAAFFWGQSYGGTLLQLIAGIAMRGFGTTIEVLAITSVLFWTAAAIVLRLIVQRSVGRSAGDLAGVLFWFPGAVLFSASTTDPGFYGPTVVLGLASIWIVLRRPRSRGWAALGLLVGLSLWTSPMALAMALPAAVVAAARDRNFRRWILGGSAAIIGALPWLIETARNSSSSVETLAGRAVNVNPDSFASMFTDMLPAAFPLSGHELVRFIVAMMSVFALAALLYFGLRQRNLGAMLVGLSSVFLIIVLVLGSGVRLAGDSVRYSSFLLPGLAFAVAWWATRHNWAQWVIISVALLVTLGQVAQASEFFTLSTGSRFDPALMEVAGELESKGISAAYGDYWLAYATSAATNERLTVAALAPRRYLGYEEAAAASSPMTIVVYADRENDVLLQTRAGLPHFARSVIAGYAVYEFDKWFDPFTLPLHLF